MVFGGLRSAVVGSPGSVPRLPPREGGGFACAVAGRALHDEQGHAPLPGLVREGERVSPVDLDRDTAAALAMEWEHRAKAEWASVPAFIQLAEQLEIAGAPARLVVGVLGHGPRRARATRRERAPRGARSQRSAAPRLLRLAQPSLAPAGAKLGSVKVGSMSPSHQIFVKVVVKIAVKSGVKTDDEAYRLTNTELTPFDSRK